MQLLACVMGEVSAPTTSLSQSMQGLPSMEVESDVGGILDEKMHGCTMGLQSERDEERERERRGLQLGAVSHWMFRWQ